MKLTVSVSRKHPQGEHRRAGYAFSRLPRIVNVTAEEAEAILGDEYLDVVSKTARKRGQDETP